MTTCRLCLGPHNRNTHAATVRLHRWLRARIKAYLKPVEQGPKGRRTQQHIQLIGRVPQILPDAPRP